ncbi:MAG: KpsF/GutQ family sugar-phosphate isomerase [bacterium]
MGISMILEHGRKVLKKEAEAIANLAERLDEEFVKAIELIYECKGKVVVTGMGKSGIICKKIAATLSSTGTPALFMHPAEAVHGDLGILSRDDIIIAISNSGETEEIVRLLPIIERFGVRLISITGNRNSLLAKHSQVLLEAEIEGEACPMGLVPTVSTTVALALGDAIAISLLQKRGFKEDDFAAFHPAGKLGQKLIQVKDLMHKGKRIPLVTEDTAMKDVILEMTTKELGTTSVVNKDNILVGIVTDGDLRRILEKKEKPLDLVAKEFMTHNPRVIDKNELAAKALQLMEGSKITTLMVVDHRGEPEGIIHIHDLLRANVV